MTSAKTNLPLVFLQRSVRTWEIRRAHRLARWRVIRTQSPRKSPRRRAAWKAYSEADRKLRERRAQLAWRQAHRQVTPRGRAVAYARSFAGRVSEQPPGSNRGGVITTWEQRLGPWLVGQAWCGTFCANVLLHAGVRGVTSRLAGVSLIEDDARAGRGPFSRWTTDVGSVRGGDLVVLFGRGVHVELVVSVDLRRGVVNTVGGNTSSGSSGSQANGGGVYARSRPLAQVHGFALVNYPQETR